MQSHRDAIRRYGNKELPAVWRKHTIKVSISVEYIENCICVFKISSFKVCSDFHAYSTSHFRCSVLMRNTWSVFSFH